MDPAGQKMMGRHSTRGFVKLSFETESPGAPDRGHKTFRRRPLVIQFSRSLPPPTSRVCGQLARSCCAPAVTDRGDPQTSPASPKVRSPTPSRSQVTPVFLGGRGVERRRPDPGIPEAASTAALCPRRSGLPAPAPSPSAAAWPPRRPPARSRTRPCSPWPRPPPGGRASKPLPRAPKPPTHRPARPLASPRLPVHPRRLAGHASRSSAGHALQTTPPGVCAWPGAEPGPRPRAFWSAATC